MCLGKAASDSDLALDWMMHLINIPGFFPGLSESTKASLWNLQAWNALCEISRLSTVMLCQAWQETRRQDPAGREMVYSPVQRSVSVRSRAEVIITHMASTSDPCPIRGEVYC